MFRIQTIVRSLSKSRSCGSSSKKNLLQRQRCYPYYQRLLSTAPIESDSSDEEKNPHFPHLFKPLDLGPAIGSLPNRVLMGSMHSGLEVSE